MFKGFKILKSYYKLARINPYLLVLEFLTLLIPSIFSIISTVLAANLITAITVYDFSHAVYLLSVDFALIVVSAISYFCYYLLSNKINKTIVFNFQNYLYGNVKANKNINSINMSTLNNISICVDFNKDLLYKICFFIKSVILLVIIIHFNLLIGFALIFVSFVSYFLLRITDSKIQKNNLALSKYQLESLELFNSIQQGLSVEQNYNLEESLKDKYFKYVETGVKTTNKISLFYNINNNFISLILKGSVFVATLYLIGLVKSTTLTLSLYLILTPYLSSSAQNLISFFDIFSKFGIIENILDEYEALKFSEKPPKQKAVELSTYNIYFYHVYLNEPALPKINDLNLTIKFGELINFVGEADCGKRAVFYLLQKTNPPSSGTIFIDNKNISDISHDSYKKLVSSTTKKPYFFNISIHENLMLVCGHKTKISNAVKSFGLKPMIDKQPDGINTIITENTSSDLLFFLGILRCFLSDAKIINIYETPEPLKSDEREIFKKILHFLKNKRTVILYTHTDDYSPLCNQTYYMENNLIKNTKK